MADDSKKLETAGRFLIEAHRAYEVAKRGSGGTDYEGHRIVQAEQRVRQYGGDPTPARNLSSYYAPKSSTPAAPSVPKTPSLPRGHVPAQNPHQKALLEQRQVAQLTNQGVSQREIAKEVGIAQTTVRRHQKKNEEGKETKRGAAISRKGDRLKAWQRKKLEAQKLNEGKKPGEKRHYASERWSEGGWRHTLYTK